MATYTTTTRFSLVKKLLLAMMLAAAARIVRTLASISLTSPVLPHGLSFMKDASDSSTQVVDCTDDSDNSNELLLICSQTFLE